MQNSEKRRRVLFPIQDVCTTANLKLYGRRVRQIARVDFVKSQYARSLQSIHSGRPQINHCLKHLVKEKELL